MRAAAEGGALIRVGDSMRRVLRIWRLDFQKFRFTTRVRKVGKLYDGLRFAEEEIRTPGVFGQS